MSSDESVVEFAVDFRDKSIKIDGRKDAEEIINRLKSCLQMTTLCLSGNTLGVDGADAIGSQLSAHKNLHRCLFSDLFTGRMVDEIAPALSHLSRGIISAGAQLTELDLSDNAFGPRGVIGVTELLSSPVCFTLKILKMNNQGLGTQGCGLLAEALSKGIKNSGGNGLKLTHFSAGRNRLEDVGAGLLATVFSQMQSLEELHLYQNGIGLHGMDGILSLTAAIAQNTHMRVLNLSDNSLTADGGNAVAQILCYLPKLEELILDDCLIRARGCKSIARKIEKEDVVPNILRLSLSGNEITRDAGVSLVLSLASKAKIRHLNLNANEFGPAGVDRLILVLGSVNLLHTLDFPNGGGREQLDKSKDYKLAFNEDQGSGDEDEDDYDEESYEEDYSETPDSQPEDEENSSFQTVKDKSNGIAVDAASDSSVFSFRSFLTGLKTGPVSGDQSAPHMGLFSSLDTTDASACRSKLWANNAFGTQGATGNRVVSAPPSNLFGPSKLFSTQEKSTHHVFGGICSPPSSDSAIDDNIIATTLKRCLSSTEDDILLHELSCKLPNLVEWTPTVQTSLSEASPESLVRLAFRFSRLHASNPACRQLSVRLLLSACARKDLSTIANPPFISSSARAVNGILVHLGALKVDRDDPIQRKTSEESTKYAAADLDLLKDFVLGHSNELSDSVRCSLSCLLQQKRIDKPLVSKPLVSTLDAVLESLGALAIT